MKLVYVTAGFPFPLTSGYLRHYHLLERLAVDHEIRLFSLVGRDHDAEDRAAIERLGIDVATFDVQSTARRRSAARIARLAPRIVAGGAAELRRAVDLCVRSGWPDAAVISGKTTAGVLRSVAGVPVLLDACDATSLRLESLMGERQGLARSVARLELRALQSVERRMLERADHVLVASVRDGDQLGWSSSMSVLSNGVDTAYWSRATDSRPLDTVIFTGKMSFAPNEDAALRLIHDVLPSVRSRRPGARLVIAGTAPTARLVKAAQRSDVEVTGAVDDMRVQLERATVFAAPLRHGAGIQNKVLEALAMGLPVVASSNAADGLVVGAQQPPLRITDDLAQMADLLVDELQAATEDVSPVAGNRLWVAEHFDWDASAARVEALLADLVTPIGRHA